MNPSNDETISLNGASPGSRPLGIDSNTKPVIGDYELLDVVAHGGMGVVYRARQVSLNRIVAVKMIREFEFATESDRIRFRAEAESAAALNHPNTVPIYEVGEHNGQPYFSMRLVEGGSLAKGIAAGDWPINDHVSIRKAVRLMQLVALAVHDAHQRGIIHRDLKPGNILVDEDGVPFVADYGLAKRHSNRDQVTQTGSVVGTPAFMSPEQAVGKEITIATDIYSLGAILYNLLGGRPPIQADTPVELFKQLMDTPATPVRKLNRLVDKDIETVCQKCLEKEPSKRYGSAKSLADDLQDWLDGKPITARPIGSLTRLYRWSKRNPMNVAVSGVALALGLVIMGTLALGYLSTKNAIGGFKRERYANRIAQTAAAFNDGSPLDAEPYLTKEIPIVNQEDLRGWEWYYLKRKSPIEYQLGGYYLNARWSPDGKRFAVLATDSVNYLKRTISVWDYANTDPDVALELDSLLSEPPKFTSSVELAPGSQSFSNATWDPTGRFLATMIQGDGLRIWDTQSKSLHSTVEWNVDYSGGRESPMQWSHDGQQLAVISPIGTIKLHSMETKKTENGPKISLESKDSVVSGITWGPDDSWLAIAESKRTQFMDMKTYEVSATWPVSVIAWNQDRSRWICERGIGKAGSADVTVEVNLRKSSVWSPDGRWIASVEGDRVLVIDTDSGKLSREYFVRNAYGPVWFPDSDRLLLNNGRVLRNLSWSSKDFEKTLDAPLAVLEASRDGSTVAVVSQDSSQIQLISSNGKTPSVLNANTSPVLAIDWRHDDEQIASLDSAGKVHVWKVQDGSHTQVLTLLDQPEENPSPLNRTDWQIRWSPDDKLLAASAAGSKIQVWNSEHGTIQGQMTKKNARILGWISDPMSLNIQIYGSNSLTFPRQRNTPYLESANVSRIINWDVANNATHTFSTCILANSSKAAVAWPDDKYYYSVGWFGNGLVRDTLESVKQTRWSLSNSSSSLSDLPISEIELADPPSRIFSLSEAGSLELKDVERNSTLLRLGRCSKDSLLSYSASKLWVADGKTLRLFDATLANTDKVRTRHGSRSLSNEALNQLVVQVLLVFLMLAPVWIVLDLGIQMTLSRRWVIATCIVAVAALLISQYKIADQLNWSNPQMKLFWVAAVLVAAGNTAFVSESLRLASHGKWIVPILLWLCLLLGALLILGYCIWPSAWQLDQDPNLFSLSWIVFPVCFVTFVIGVILFAGRFATGDYSSSFRFRSAPFWVKWLMWGCKSTRFAIIQTPFEFLFYCAILVAGFNVPAPLKWVLIVIGILSLPLPIGRAFAIRWLIRNGGWDAQIEKSKL